MLHCFLFVCLDANHGVALMSCVSMPSSYLLSAKLILGGAKSASIFFRAYYGSLKVFVSKSVVLFRMKSPGTGGNGDIESENRICDHKNQNPFLLNCCLEV